jgi:hypothetical protein
MGWDLEERRTVAGVLDHLQNQFAFQQLTMEIYNDALFSLSDGDVPGDEALARSPVTSSNLALVRELLIPAADRVALIAQTMTSEHQSYPRPQRPKEARDLYDEWSAFLDLFVFRADSRGVVFRELVLDPGTSLEGLITLSTLVDRNFFSFLANMNSLLAKSEIYGEEWLMVALNAVNRVRERFGMPPFEMHLYRQKLADGVAGGRPRYFDAS